MKADCHIHMVLDGEDWRSAIARHRNAPDIPWIRQQLAEYQRKGYTYLRDGGDRWGVGAAARTIAPEFGITYRTPLANLCQKGHYGGFIGQTYENLAEYTALVGSLRRRGGDFVKIMISGLMDFSHCGVLTEPGLPPAQIKELIHIAHQEGLAVMAHANGTETVLAAAEAGVDSVEHGAYLNQEALCAMAEAGTVWVPTLSTIGNLRGKNRFPEKEIQAILEGALENVATFSAMGGLLAPGSDAGAWAVPHGADTEEALLKLAGVEDLADGIAAIVRKF